MTKTETPAIKTAELLDRRATLHELLVENKEVIGLQSYEYLDDKSEERKLQVKAFKQDEITAPYFEYPLIDEASISSVIHQLEGIIYNIDDLEEPDRSIIWDTISYRMAEAYWLLSAKRATTALRSKDPRALEYVREAQDLNEQLYGKPDEELHTNILGEIYQQAQAKELTPIQKRALDELEKGFTTEVAGEEVKIPPIGFSPEYDRLPEFKKETKEKLTNILHRLFPETFQVVDEYYSKVIMQRPTDKRFFNLDDIEFLFNKLIKYIDPTGGSGVSAATQEGSSTLAWSTPDLAVKIGVNRDPIESPSTMAALIVHELNKHAGGTINGFRFSNPILGMGIFTEADDGECPDYLTFEEGLASLSQQALDDSRAGWDFLSFGKQLAIGLAYQGLDHRQTYEILRRVRLVTDVDGEIDNKSNETNNNKAELASRRIFRGTPLEMPRIDEDGEKIIMTFNKDLAYLPGKLKVIKWLEEASEEEIIKYLALKADPTNKYHRDIVDYITGMIIDE